MEEVLGELDTLIGTLDDQKENIIRAVEAVNNLAKTLNRERDTVVEAIDTMGPAITVLVDQHDQLITMLEQLDRLCVVGTRVIEGTREDLLATMRHLRPVLTKLNEAGQSLPEALDLIISFPFPKEASEVVKGDYANTGIVFDVALDTLFDQLGDQDLPLPDLIDICSETPLSDLCEDLPLDVVEEICAETPLSHHHRAARATGAVAAVPGCPKAPPVSATVSAARRLVRPRTPARKSAAGTASAPRRWAPSGVVSLVLLGSVTLVIVAAAGFFAFDLKQMSEADDARGAGQAMAAEYVEKMLSYDHKRIDKDVTQATELMTDDFADEYTSTIAQVREEATATKSVVKAEVVASSVSAAGPDRVEALLFVNQTTNGKQVKEPRVDLNRVVVTLVRDGDGCWSPSWRPCSHAVTRDP